MGLTQRMPSMRICMLGTLHAADAPSCRTSDALPLPTGILGRMKEQLRRLLQRLQLLLQQKRPRYPALPRLQRLRLRLDCLPRLRRQKMQPRLKQQVR